MRSLGAPVVALDREDLWRLEVLSGGPGPATVGVVDEEPAPRLRWVRERLIRIFENPLVRLEPGGMWDRRGDDLPVDEQRVAQILGYRQLQVHEAWAAHRDEVAVGAKPVAIGKGVRDVGRVRDCWEDELRSAIDDVRRSGEITLMAGSEQVHANQMWEIVRIPRTRITSSP